MTDSVNTNNLPYFTKRYLETDAMFREAIDFANHCIIHTPGAEKHMLQLIELHEASRQAHLAVHGDFGTISHIEAQMSNVSSLTDEVAVEENTHTTTTEATINDNHTNEDDACFSVSSTEFHTQPKPTNDIHKLTKIRIKNEEYSSCSTQTLTQINFGTPGKKRKVLPAKKGKKGKKGTKKIKTENDGMKQTLLPFVDLTNVDDNRKKPAQKK